MGITQQFSSKTQPARHWVKSECYGAMGETTDETAPPASIASVSLPTTGVTLTVFGLSSRFPSHKVLFSLIGYAG
jgi:hypothetical protein